MIDRQMEILTKKAIPFSERQILTRFVEPNKVCPISHLMSAMLSCRTTVQMLLCVQPTNTVY